MKLINLLIIALSAASTSADENKAAAALRGTVNSVFQDIMSSNFCVAPGHTGCKPHAAPGSAVACCTGQAAGGGSYSCNPKVVYGSDAGPNDPGHVSYMCEENGDDEEDIVEEKDIMSTLSCHMNSGTKERDDSCGNDDQCASCCCYSQGGGPSEGSDVGPREREAHGKTCKPTGWCNSFLDEDTDGDVVAAVEEEEEEDVEEEEEDFAALSCVAPGHTCEPHAHYTSAAACCTGPSAGGPHWCNCVPNTDGSDAGPAEGSHVTCTCEGDHGDEEEFPFVAAASS